MRIADIVASVPSLLYVILIMMVLGANEVSILVGLCISGWIETARIVRGEVMRIKEREFVLASRLAGAGPLRIFLTYCGIGSVSFVCDPDHDGTGSE